MERKLARLARRAHGVVSRRQLLEAGVTRTEIAHRLRRGDLIAVFRGVYRVGHTAPSTEAGYTAAVKAGGDEALLSGQAAGHLLELLKGAPPAPEVTAPKARRVKGVRVRRGRRQGTVWRGIPVTTVAETIVDLAAELAPDELARAFHQAGIRHHTTPGQVEAALARRPTPREQPPCAGSCAATSTSPSAHSSNASSLCSHSTASRYPRPTGPPALGASTAAGPATGSPSSSTATATSAPATPGRTTATANAKPTPAATTTAATPTTTCSKTRPSCSPS